MSAQVTNDIMYFNDIRTGIIRFVMCGNFTMCVITCVRELDQREY